MYFGYASLDGLEKINRPMCALPKEREELLLLEDRHVQYFRGKYQSTREWGGGGGGGGGWLGMKTMNFN